MIKVEVKTTEDGGVEVKGKAKDGSPMEMFSAICDIIDKMEEMGNSRRKIYRAIKYFDRYFWLPTGKEDNNAH